jgi:hypothetical protein
MTLTILDPCTGNRVTIEVPAKEQTQRTRRWVLRELDRVAAQIPKNDKPIAIPAWSLQGLRL